MRPSTTVHLASAPAFGAGAEVTVPAGADVRLVYGTVAVKATASVDAFITLEVENGVGTAVYDEVMEMRAALGLLQELHGTYAVMVECGRRYRFMRSNGAGTTETILKYSYSDM